MGRGRKKQARWASLPFSILARMVFRLRDGVVESYSEDFGIPLVPGNLKPLSGSEDVAMSL